MARVKGNVVSRARKKKRLKLAKGYFGSKHRLYRTANEQVMRSQRYSYVGRKQLKRQMRKMWITRINAAARMNGISYSQLTVIKALVRCVPKSLSNKEQSLVI